MTRARWILSAVTLSLLWLAEALILVPSMERDLEAAAQHALATQPVLAEQLGDVSLYFDGLQARLTGKVRNPRDRLVIETTLRDLVRAPTPLGGSFGLHFNPVSAVLGEIDVVPFPPGWMLLAATGTEARLLGTTASLHEARDLMQSVQESWSAHGGRISGMPAADGKKYDEAANPAATLRDVPAPRPTAQAFLARIGQPWKKLSLDHDEAVLRAEAGALGIEESEWQQQVRPVLQELRTTLHQQREAEARELRLSRLPPGHLFIAAQGMHVVFRGELGSAAMKHAILDEAIRVLAPRRVHDEIRVSTARRPSGDFGPITIALLPSGKNTRSLGFGLSGEAWKTLDWQITPAEQAWKEGLPSDIDRAQVREDSTRLIGWLSGDGTHDLPSSLKQEPAVITLALFGTKAVLAGQVAEQAARSQLIAAVRQAYSPRIRVQSEGLHFRASCQPSTSLLHTLKSLPPAPPQDSVGILAIATPGSTWAIIPASLELTRAGALRQRDDLPQDISIHLVREHASEALDQLRVWLSRLNPPVSSP